MKKWYFYLGVVVAVFLLVFLGFAGLGFWRKNEAKKTAEAIERINSQKITLADVMGENLPAKPNEEINNATVAGVDANNNAIRDDVELAIFEKYPNSAKIRAAMLQYAQALQLELTEVFNSETLVEALQKESRGINCISETGPKVNFNDSHEKVLADYAISDSWQKEVEDFIIDINVRRERRSYILNKYMTTYSSVTGGQCDINRSALPN